MRGDNLLRVLTEHQIAHLRASVHCMQWLQGMRVPKPDVAIS